jgi:RNA polymerase sigma-70 factor, ECF subfamily
LGTIHGERLVFAWDFKVPATERTLVAMSTSSLQRDSTDEELAKSVATGAIPPPPTEPALAAFSELHTRYGRMILAFVASRIRDADAAQDLSQDVWHRVWRVLPTGFKGGQFRAWLYEIARNRVFDESRKKRPQSLPDEFDPADKGEHDEVIQHERMQAFRDCFSRLDPDRRRIVELRLSGRSHEEISTDLGIPGNTAMTRFHRAKQDLAQCMQSKLP